LREHVAGNPDHMDIMDVKIMVFGQSIFLHKANPDPEILILRFYSEKSASLCYDW